MWASMAFGPAVNIKRSRSQFKLIQTFGYHFSGNASGPAIAIDLQESFGDHWTSLAIVPKFVWDIRIIPGLGFYISPFAGLGYAGAWADCPAHVRDCWDIHGITFQFGVQGKLILGDRGLVFFQPLAFDVSGGTCDEPLCDWDTAARWDMMFGGGVIF